MSDGTVALIEATPAKNWPAGRRPEWVDERTRLYTGVSIRAAGRKWHEILTAYDGTFTTAYLTQNGFDLEHHGPAINVVKGACHRKAVREFFRDQYQLEVRFA